MAEQTATQDASGVEATAQAEPKSQYDEVEPGDEVVPPGDAQDEPQQQEVPAAEDAPVVETKAEKAVRLKELRKGDGTLDEDLIEKVVMGGAASTAEIQRAQRYYQNNPEFRLAYLKSFKADGGQLTPEQEAELTAASKPPVVEKKEPPKPKYALSAVMAEYYKGVAQGAADKDLKKYWTEFVQPAMDEQDAQRVNAAYAERDAKEKAREEEAAKTAASQATIRTLRTEGAEAAEDWKGAKLWVKDDSFQCGYRCTDNAVYQAAYPHIERGVSISDATLLAMKKLKRLQNGPAPKPVTKPAINNVRVTKREVQDKRYDIAD